MTYSANDPVTLTIDFVDAGKETADIDMLLADAVRMVLDIPDELRNDFTITGDGILIENDDQLDQVASELGIIG